MLTDIKHDILVFVYLTIVVPTVLLLCLVDRFLPKRPIGQQAANKNR